MKLEQERNAALPCQQRDDQNRESLTDMIDRMDREAFRRSLEQRDLRTLANDLQPRERQVTKRS